MLISPEKETDGKFSNLAIFFYCYMLTKNDIGFMCHSGVAFHKSEWRELNMFFPLCARET